VSGREEKLRYLLGLQESEGGAIPFERWMGEALYHPDFGYYTANLRDIGRGGDFTTWPMRQDSLARGLARWVRQHRDGGRRLIEIGAGTGNLARSLQKSLGWWNRPDYHIVEASPRLRARQRELLGGRAHWHETPQEALKACGGRALIFSNELVDAFPCQIFRKEGDGWLSLALRVENGKIEEIWREAALPDSTFFGLSWLEGRRVEVHDSYRRWLNAWRPHWKAGCMLTIDYGAEATAFSARRPGGSLRAYAHHQRFEGHEAYLGFGIRDLTADVNFSDLIRWGEAAGLRTVHAGPLGSFLKEQGIESGEMAEAGEAFRVLVQSPGEPGER